jgi:hypothetical protein
MIKNYDRTEYGWLQKAVTETKLSLPQIRWTCKKIGVDYKPVRGTPQSELICRFNLVKEYYKKAEWNWKAQASKTTGLSIKKIETAIKAFEKGTIKCSI